MHTATNILTDAGIAAGLAFLGAILTPFISFVLYGVLVEFALEGKSFEEIRKDFFVLHRAIWRKRGIAIFAVMFFVIFIIIFTMRNA